MTRVFAEEMDHERVDNPLVTADYLAETLDGPLLRLAGDPQAAAALRIAFDELAAANCSDLDFVRGVRIQFRCGERAGLRRIGDDAFQFGGSAEQWRERADLLEPLTTRVGFQYLDYDGTGDVGVVVTTYPDGSF